ncbi:Mic26p [Sugiyamaella lignohabitans]|uniref:MICOS complex subunit n=1 Tax=Sugiyamaella lignohabitans TaxID=796027 RepID=A0A167BWK8_9ASCO|nr:Mic26p [Sugiyamaella lignohabitans]ANB10919.1 Mic26p [Sugiyamaella lignohabitans]
MKLLTGQKQLLTLLGAGIVSYSAIPVAMADSKKPIYDDEEKNEETVVVVQPEETQLINTEYVGNTPIKSSKFLEENIEVARKWVYEQSQTVQAKVDDSFQTYLQAERSVTSTVSNLKDENEDILPGGIYILIGALSGSIFARRRGFVLRTVTPVIFGLGAFSYFLPKTFNNTRALVWSFEQKSPAIADTHIQIQNQVESLAESAKSAAEQSQSSLESGVHSVRQFVAESTGLQIGSSSSSNNKK